jgi:hypothetical protein
MIINSQKTLWALDLSSHQMLGTPYKIMPNTSLNQKFDILPDAEVGDVYPTIKYFALGVGGADIINDSSLNHSLHKPIDAALFEHIPFVMRPVTDDLQPEDKLNYRFRTIEIFNGISYACYYLRVIDNTEMKSGLYEIHTSDDISSLGYFDTNRTDLLNPIPRVVDNYTTPSENTYVARVVKLLFELSVLEKQYIKDVIDIRFAGNRILTEIGVCSGTDVVTDIGTEAKSVQINYFIKVDIDMIEEIVNDGAFVRNIEIGGSEPLIQ